MAELLEECLCDSCVLIRWQRQQAAALAEELDEARRLLERAAKATTVSDIMAASDAAWVFLKDHDPQTGRQP